MWTRLVIGYVSSIASILLLSAVGAAAAQGTVDSSHSVWAVATASQTNVSLTNTSAGNAVLVIVAKNSTANRTHTVTDDLGNSYTLVGSAGNCASQLCVSLFANYSVTGTGTRVVSVLQSGTLVSYGVLAFAMSCSPNICEADQFSSLVQSATVSHKSSAGATVIDTAANSVVVAGCLTSGNTGTISGLGTYEAFADSSSIFHAMFEDDIATAFTDEQGAWTSANSVASTCLIASIKATVVTAPACPDSGASANDFFDCLSDFDGVVSQGQTIHVDNNAMRSQADVSAVATPSSVAGVDYVYSTDPYVHKQDAAKVVIPPLGNSIVSQPRFDVAINQGDVLFTWDTWKANEWNIGSTVCAGNGTQTVQKSYQFAAPKVNGNGSDSMFWFEVRDLFAGANQVAPPGVAPTGTIPWTPVKAVPISSVTATGTTAHASTAPNNHPFTDGQVVTVAGASNVLAISIATIGTGSQPTVTTVADHGLTGTFDVRVNGETPNVIFSSPADYFTATVTGARTFTIQTLDPNFNLTQSSAGGTATVYPYSKRDATIHTTGLQSFDYTIAASNPSASTGGPIYALGNLDTQVTGGTDCFTVDVRNDSIYLGPRSSDDGHLRAQIANFKAKCKEWVRYWVLYEPNQGAAWTCGADATPATGNLDLMSVWVASESTPPVQIYDRVPVELDRLFGTDTNGNVVLVQSDFGTGPCATYTNVHRNYTSSLLENWWEHNSSGGACNLGFAYQMIGYDKNWTMIHTAATDNAIVGSANSITVNGKEVLIRPVP